MSSASEHMGVLRGCCARGAVPCPQLGVGLAWPSLQGPGELGHPAATLLPDSSASAAAALLAEHGLSRTPSAL